MHNAKFTIEEWTKEVVQILINEHEFSNKKAKKLANTFKDYYDGGFTPKDTVEEESIKWEE